MTGNRSDGDSNGFEGTRLSNSPKYGPFKAVRKVIKRHRSRRNE